jgi:23S rRNA (cytosine1962-C5)-methyltransferase
MLESENAVFEKRMVNKNHAQPTAARSSAQTRAQKASPLRLRVSAAAESILRGGHPWLFAQSVRSQNRPGQMGELAVIYDRKDRFLALGLFDPSSPLRVRILHAGKRRLVDQGFWNEKLERALQLRSNLFDERTNGFRWINGESDGWPGLVLDRYGGTLVLKLYTAAWIGWLDEITDRIRTRLQPERIILRLSRNAQESATGLSKKDGEVVWGAPLNAPVIFMETGLQFEADVARGQKTGFFLDQRENRQRIETLAGGRTVLNAFSFSGGFSFYAARGGARSVVDLDISAHALAAAQRNFSLNESDKRIRDCAHRCIQADAFEWLASNGHRKFSLIVLDPPSLAKREAERLAAIGAYQRLAALGIEHLTSDGILLACSCSAHVSEEEFFEAVLAAARKSKRGFGEIGRTGQPQDHPATFKEARYLKAIYVGFH